MHVELRHPSHPEAIPKGSFGDAGLTSFLQQYFVKFVVILKNNFFGVVVGGGGAFPDSE